MMINMLLEEAGQYFYCEAKKTAHHEFEGIVHFLHKIGDGNAFIRANTCHLKAGFASRDDALGAAERHGKVMSRNVAPAVALSDYTDRFAAAPPAGRLPASSAEKSPC
jgi:hypothetical protein